MQQIEQVRLGFIHGLTTTQVDFYAKEKFDAAQMEEIRLALEDGLTYEDIDKFAKVEFGHEQMNHVRIKISNDKKIGEEKKSNLLKKRLKNGLLFSCLLLVLLGGGVFVFFAKEEIALYFQPLELSLTTDKVTLNINEPFIAMNYVAGYTEGENIELILPYDITTTTLGEQKILYKLKNEKKVVSKIIILTVLDNEGPLLELKEHTVTLIRNKETFSCRNYIASCDDNVDGDCRDFVECSDELDKSLSKQVIHYVITDTSGNTVTKELEVSFKEEVKVPVATKAPSSGSSGGQSPSTAQPSTPTSSGTGGWTIVEDSGWIYEDVPSDVTVEFE